MINSQLINPKSIVVIGASNNIEKPGGKILKNILDGKFRGDLFVVNSNETKVQNQKSYKSVSEIPNVELAIIAVASKYCVEIVEILVKQKNTKAFIILSAGFGEESVDGKKIETEIVNLINSVDGSLIGPNCIGVLNQNYSGVFTTPIPKVRKSGCDFISSSGATAVFIMEMGISRGLSFSSVYSVGNAAQIGVEDVLKFFDETFDTKTSSRTKILYIESIKNPQLFLKHARSLIQKGCRIAAIKAGASDEGSRAASSHTGAMANSDVAVDALFKKAGIVRCSSRDELVSVASIFMHKKLKSKNIAIITHAGGPAVMLTDALSKGGFKIPKIENKFSSELLKTLYQGSSVSNPIDFLATGTAQQLETIIDYCETKFTEIDAMIVIFGSPGLFNVSDVYNVLDKTIKSCKKTIFTVLPSVINAKNEIENYQSKNHINFPDEVSFANALAKVFANSSSLQVKRSNLNLDKNKIREIIQNSKSGYLDSDTNFKILELCGISKVKQIVVKTEFEAIEIAKNIGFPLVLKVEGLLHKSDSKGVVLNVNSISKVKSEFKRLMQIENSTGISIQPMLKGIELFVGVKRESNFGHLIMCGMGGIFVEVLQDIQVGLASISNLEAKNMIQNLKSFPILKGIRGQKGVNIQLFAEIIERISNLLEIAPEIEEMDINPLIASKNEIVAVDVRIKITP